MNFDNIESKYQFLLSRHQLTRKLDDLLENSIQSGFTIEKTLREAIDLLQQNMPKALIKTLTQDEKGRDLELGSHEGWPDQLELNELDKKAEGSIKQIKLDQGECLYRSFDMVDEHLGTTAVWIPNQSTISGSVVEGFLEDWVEVIDNYLAAKTLSRKKHKALTQISDALKHPILEYGIEAAVNIFSEFVEFDDLLLVCQSDDVLDRHTTCFRVYADGQHVLSSLSESDPEIISNVEQIAWNPTSQGLRTLGFKSEYWVKAPLLDALDKGLAGLVIVGSKNPINPLQEQLADRFADYLRQRVVDFSKEFEELSNTFPQKIVRRLLKEQDYAARYLSPRERNVAILFADLSGFTYVSEQILIQPEIIARLMHTWGYEVVQIIWESGGVFDKMVGDCVIALWGPPFYELNSEEACSACLAAAKKIRAYTNEMASSGVISELKDLQKPLGVSIGLNYAPLYIGHLGPGQDFTGFSSGMNNTARLQGLAGRDEILGMESFVQELGDDQNFGEKQKGKVKNVAQPIVYRKLLKKQ
ncbi:MAG: adenylate/guanylate cyclase domain-containing protein [Bacteroidia bacterium]|nr:adenylate/guanylate cyclase domain-containing protein [Bacteroidia bacterium]